MSVTTDGAEAGGRPWSGRALAGRCAVVTGGGSGIGRACAWRLAEAGADVALLDVRRDAVEQARETIAGVGTKVLAVAVDVCDADGVDRAVDEVRSSLGNPSILVNAAGIVVRKKLLDSSIAEWRRVVDVNLTGYAVLLKAVVPAMIDAAGGSIVQVASIAGHIGYGFSSYTAAKGGVLALTKQLAAELAEHGIRINSISPGVVHTGLNIDTLANAEIRDATVDNTPVGRIGDPDEIANAARFLVGPESGFVTGADLLVDGGMTSTIHWGSAGATLHDFHASPGS